MKESTSDLLVEGVGWIFGAIAIVVIAAAMLGIVMAVAYAARFGWELAAMPGTAPSAPVPPVE